VNAINHLRAVEQFIRNYPIRPDMMLSKPGRGLSVGREKIEQRENPFTVYYDLANHIDGYIKELIMRGEGQQ